MGIGELQLRLRSIEGMRLGQFLLQVLLVDLLWVSVLVHVQIEGLTQWEVLLVCHVRFREVVLVDGFSDS